MSIGSRHMSICHHVKVSLKEGPGLSLLEDGYKGRYLP